MSPSNNVFSAVSFISFVLVCIPLPWHLEAWNTGTVLYMLWTAVSLLNFFINSVIWNNNAINWAPVWCDISSKLIVGTAIGIPSASLCINRRLYYIASVRSVTKSKGDKYRAICSDLVIGVGVPLIIMALHYVVQGHRFNIFEDIGCYPATYNVTLQYILIQTPILIIPLVSGTFAFLSILTFRKRRAEFREILSSNSRNLSANRYFRLMALASIEVVSGLPLTLTFIIMNATLSPVQPWISWEDTHSNFSRVLQVPAVLWKADPSSKASLEMTRWLTVCCGLIFFAFFGFADEAQRHYKMAMDTVVKKMGYTTTRGSATKVGSMPGASLNSSGFNKFKASSTNAASSIGGRMPVFVKQEVIEKRDSLDSMSDITSIRDTSSQLSTEVDSLKKPAEVKPMEMTPPSHNDIKIEISSPIYDNDHRRSSFPASFTPSNSFLDLSTASEAALRNACLASADNRV